MIGHTVVCRCPRTPTLLLALCFVIWWFASLGWGRHHRPARCSLAGLRKTARRPAVFVIGNVLLGPVQLAFARLGTQQSALCDNLPLCFRAPLDVGSPAMDFALPVLLEWLSRVMHLGESVVCFFAPLPSLLLLLLPLSS